MRRLKRVFNYFRQACVEFGEDGCTTMAAALAYYALFSIPPLILIVILAAGMLWGEEVAQENLSRELTQIFDRSGAELILDVMQHARDKDTSFWATLVSVVVLFVGSTGVMVQLQIALNQVWNYVPPATDSHVRRLVIKRILSFVMVLTVATLLFASLVATAVLAATVTFLDPYLPGETSHWLSYFGNLGVTYVVVVLLLAALFRWLPDVHVYWGDVWVGASITALLFMIGKELLGWYLGTRNLSGYGGAGALVLLLMWIYYTSMIILFGAELTQVWAQSRGHQRRARSRADS
ncbi:YihY/virulence factor BrkB family protein [Planctomicrobium sp. SH661]|uniref:YihY/virulence factor BrkB family protein n=1 Tax=Planctomicrobium sp. SH661 TaxID=3448124 RepID=UPI003F5B3DE6